MTGLHAAIFSSFTHLSLLKNKNNDQENHIRRPHVGGTSLCRNGTDCSNNSQASAQQDDDAKYATELLKPGTEAPDFALATPDGKTVKLSDMRGKYVVLDFWASWCPDCRKDLPAIAALHNTYAERGVEFIGVSFDDKKENLVKAISDFNIAYTQVSELKKWKETQISAAYHIKWIPSMYLIAPDGKVVVSTVMKDKIAAKLAEIMPGCDEQSACCKKETTCCKQKTTCTKATACKKATTCKNE